MLEKKTKKKPYIELRIMLMVNVLKFRTLYSILFWLFMQWFLKILKGMANSVNSDQIAPLGAVWSGTAFCICYFVRNFGVQNFRTFTVLLKWNSDLHTMLVIILGTLQDIVLFHCNFRMYFADYLAASNKLIDMLNFLLQLFLNPCHAE